MRCDTPHHLTHGHLHPPSQNRKAEEELAAQRAAQQALAEAQAAEEARLRKEAEDAKAQAEALQKLYVVRGLAAAGTGMS